MATATHTDPKVEALERQARDVAAGLRRPTPGPAPAPSRAATETLAALDRAGGRPLDPSVAAGFGAEMGFDFSRVRIHADGEAARTADGMGAAAFAVGRHVVFGPGRYDPAGADGRRLLGHELAHVAQTRAQP